MPTIDPILGLVPPDPPIQHSRIRRMDSGWIDKLPSTSLPDNAIQDGQNMYFKDGQVLTSRFGYVEVNSSAIGSSSGIRGLFGYYKNDGNRYLIAASGTLLYYNNSGTFTALTGASGLGLTNNLEWDAAQFGDSLFMGNGTDAMVKVTGTTAAALTQNGTTVAPIGTMMVEHKNFMFVAGVSATPNRLFFSAIADPESWDTGVDFLDVVTNDGSPITGLASLGDSLIIFKSDQVYALDGANTTTFFLQRITADYGCGGNRAIANTGTTLAFLDEEGPRAVLMDTSHRFIDVSSDKIPNAFSGLNSSKIGTATVTFYKNMIIFSVADGSATENDVRLVYDVNRNAWCPKWTSGFSADLVFDNGDSQIYYSGDDTLGTVYIQNTTNTDNGTAITANLQTKDYDMGTPFNPKKYRKIWGRAKFTGTTTTRRLSVTTYVDQVAVDSTVLDYGAETAAAVGTAVVGTATLADITPVIVRERVSARGNSIGFKVENTASNQPFTLHSLEWTAIVKPAR